MVKGCSNGLILNRPGSALCGIRDQLSRDEGFIQFVIVAAGSVNYLAVFVIGSKRFGIPSRFDRKTTSLANTGDPCKITASVFAFWYANSR